MLCIVELFCSNQARIVLNNYSYSSAAHSDKNNTKGASQVMDSSSIISFRGEGVFQNMILYDRGERGGGDAETIKPQHIEAASQNKNGLGAYTILVNSCRLLLLK